MVSAYLNSICTPVAGLSAGLSCTTRGTPGLSDTVQGGLPPSPQRPGHTFLKFLILCGLSTLCSTAYPQNAESETTLKLPLTTSSMTCTELQKRLRRWYFERPCAFSVISNGPAVFAESWECRFEATRVIAFSFVAPPEVPGFCVMATDECKEGEWTINVTWYKEKLTNTDTCNRI